MSVWVDREKRDCVKREKMFAACNWMYALWEDSWVHMIVVNVAINCRLRKMAENQSAIPDKDNIVGN